MLSRAPPTPIDCHCAISFEQVPYCCVHCISTKNGRPVHFGGIIILSTEARDPQAEAGLEAKAKAVLGATPS